MTKEEELLIEESSLSDEIVDFFDEHNVIEIPRIIDEFNDVLQKIETMRSKYRRLHKELELVLKEKYEEQYVKIFNSKMMSIKDYIKCINNEKMKIYLKESSSKKNDELKQERMVKFQVDETKRLNAELRSIFTFQLSEASDAEIKRRQENLRLPNNLARDLCKKMENIMKGEIDDYETNLEEINSNYSEVMELKNSYMKQLESEVSTRDLDKKATFEVSKLNIKLSKFKGYDSFDDIYTFKTKFEKLHLESTPDNLLCDMLKNNYLEHPALSLVNIDQIWERLKGAYGDCKIMLEKKLSKITVKQLMH